MIAPNNLIFTSIPAAAGLWAACYNYSALSIHLLGLDATSNTWIEVSNNPLCDPRKYPTTCAAVYGVPITGNLAAGGPTATGNENDEVNCCFTTYGPGGPSDSTHGTMCVFSPSCLIWNYIRVVKTGGSGGLLTQAWLMGQVTT